ncbi:MAG: enoyl-CoA hydratase [Microbacteriaceae bacterium]|nr:enoyl-CoA hydratase [Microbacteriaceae bacterium]
MPTVDELVATTEEPLVVRDLGAVRVVILNRPTKKNAMSVAIRSGLDSVLSEADADPTVRAIVLTGAGGSFSAGFDLKELADPTLRDAVPSNPGGSARAVKKPLIAAVSGPCMTGGLELALSCAFIIADDTALFADTHAKVGIFPRWGMSALLPRAVGIRRAKQMTVTGVFVNAATALNWGLVNEVTTPDALFDRVMELAEMVVAGSAASQSAQLELLVAQDGEPVAAALAAEDVAAAQWVAAGRGGPTV